MRESKIWLVLPVIVVCLAAALGYVMHMERVASAAETARLEALAEEARPYIEEQEQIRNELAQNSTQYITSRSVGITMVGYALEEPEDLEMIGRHAEKYGFQPVIVLDVTGYNGNNSSRLDRLVEALNETQYEVVLTASKVDAEFLSDLEELRAELKNDTNSFLLRNTDDSEYNLSVLSQLGYAVCLRYVNSDNTPTSKEGIVCLSYNYISSSSMDIRGRLDKLNKSSLTTMFVFELDNLDEDVIVYNLNIISGYTDEGGIEYRSLQGAVEQAHEDSTSREERQAAYRAYVDERMARMAELQKIVREIYEEA